MYKLILNVPLYPIRFGIIIGDDLKKLDEYFTSQGMKDYIDWNQYNALTQKGIHIGSDKEKYSCLYVTFHVFDEYLTHGLINHEVRHLTNLILDHIGQSLDASNDECEAYLSQWVTDKIYQAFNKSGKIDLIKIAK